MSPLLSVRRRVGAHIPESRPDVRIIPPFPAVSNAGITMAWAGVCPKFLAVEFLSPRGRLRSATGRGAGDWLRSGMLFAAKVPVPAVRDNTGDRHRRTAWRSQSPAPLPPQGARINRNAYKKVRRRDLQTARKYMHTLWAVFQGPQVGGTQAGFPALFVFCPDQFRGR